jgi:Mn-dependent DtxR family transcriptional regulator
MNIFEARRAEKEKIILNLLKDERFSTARLIGVLLSTKRTATFETVKRMEKNGLLIQGQVDDKRVWGLTPAGAFLADEDGKCRHFDPKRISAITLKHDLAVQRAKISAMAMGWSHFLAERTLRQMAVKERTTWLQVPDALAVSPRGRKVAFEVERTAKTPKRYKAIFDSYCQMLADRTIQEVVYVCFEDICPRLERLFLKIETMTVDGKIHSFSDSFRKRFHFVTCDGWEDYAKDL